MKNKIIKIDGHTHYSSDFYINKTRVVSNQHGYFKDNIDYDKMMQI